jgi:hypothetical protein
MSSLKTQPANSSGQGGDEQHNMEIDGQVYSGDVKIADLDREHLQTKRKNQNKRRMIRAGSRKKNEEEEG